LAGTSLDGGTRIFTAGAGWIKIAEKIITSDINNFTFSGLDFDGEKDSMLVLVADFEATAPGEYRLLFNDIVINYFNDGERIANGVSTIIDFSSSNIIAMNNTMLGANLPIFCISYISLSKVSDRISVQSFGSSVDFRGKEEMVGTTSAAITSLTSIKVQMGTGRNFITGSRFTLYRVPR